MEGFDDPHSYVIVAAAAVVAPVLAELVRRWRVPTILFEILLGIVIGPQVLGWAEITPLVSNLSSIGLAFLIFLAGFETDFDRVRGAPLRLAVGGWGVSLVLGFGAGILLNEVGFGISDLLLGLALTTTALGTLLPMLGDHGLLPTRFGSMAMAAGTVGEFGPILAVTLLLSADRPAYEAVMLVGFAVVAILAALVATRRRPPVVVEFLHRHTRTSAQIWVRLAILLLAVMLLLASELHLDALLGAFTAGVVLRVALARHESETVESNLHAIGFGLLIPVYFIVSGMQFDLDALFDSASTMAMVPLFLALMLAIRGLPALFLYRGRLPDQERRALAVLQTVALPLVVVITNIGLETGRMSSDDAAALVAAAMLSVLVLPLVAFEILAATPVGEPGEPGPESRGAPDP